MVCLGGIITLFIGLEECYKLNTFNIGQCQVTSIDLKFRSSKLHPRWNLTIIYQNERLNYSLISSNGLTSEDDAWNNAQLYKINETYSCYRSQVEISLIELNWQWEKPSKLEKYNYLSIGGLFFLIAAILILLRRYSHREFRNRREQEQTREFAIRNEEQHHSRTLLETPPPSYDQAVLSIGTIRN